MEDFEKVVAWRRATYDECKLVDSYTKAALKRKIESALLNGSCFELVVCFWGVVFGIVKVQGGSRAYYGWILWAVLTLINVGICFLFVQLSQNRIKYINNNEFEVTDCVVIDRDYIKKGIDRGHYVTVKYSDCGDESYGDEGGPEKSVTARIRTLESVYNQVKLGTEVLVFRLKEDIYLDGFFDEFDVVVKD